MLKNLPKRDLSSFKLDLSKIINKKKKITKIMKTITIINYPRAL